jgi:hypothetical protein
VCVFLLFLCSVVGKEQTRKERSRVSKSLIKGAYFFLRKEEGRTFFESFLDPQISFARII